MLTTISLLVASIFPFPLPSSHVDRLPLSQSQLIQAHRPHLRFGVRTHAPSLLDAMLKPDSHVPMFVRPPCTHVILSVGGGTDLEECRGGAL